MTSDEEFALICEVFMISRKLTRRRLSHSKKKEAGMKVLVLYRLLELQLVSSLVV
jgi:hypothetical protein